jgi:hypothetical protein
MISQLQLTGTYPAAPTIRDRMAVPRPAAAGDTPVSITGAG